MKLALLLLVGFKFIIVELGEGQMSDMFYTCGDVLRTRIGTVDHSEVINLGSIDWVSTVPGP